MRIPKGFIAKLELLFGKGEGNLAEQTQKDLSNTEHPELKFKIVWDLLNELYIPYKINQYLKSLEDVDNPDDFVDASLRIIELRGILDDFGLVNAIIGLVADELAVVAYRNIRTGYIKDMKVKKKLTGTDTGNIKDIENAIDKLNKGITDRMRSLGITQSEESSKKDPVQAAFYRLAHYHERYNIVEEQKAVNDLLASKLKPNSKIKGYNWQAHGR
jgi:hypothetical protein